MQIFRLLRTLRHVPPAAVLWRVRQRVLGLYYRSPLYGLASLKDPEVPQIVFVGPDLIPGHIELGKDMAAGQWRLAGIPVTLRMPEDTQAGHRGMGWFPARVSALGIFELHYHEWLVDLRAAGERDIAQKLIADWLLQFGTYHPVAWHPYPTSLRIVAWLTHGSWLLEGADADLRDTFAVALGRQMEHLRRNRELDLGWNHLLKNEKALIYGGVALAGHQDMLTEALAGFLRELAVQILHDGMHGELSPLYLAQVLRDVLEVRALLRKATGGAPAALDDAVRRLGTALAFFCHGDGKLALFNDSAELEAEYIQQLLRLSGAEDAPALLPDAGYVRVVRGPLLLLFDAGRVGPDSNPGHAHADTLSFELSIGRERVIVNQGTFAYQDRLRPMLRATAAHSTVDVEGESSAEVWGNFRVGRRPRKVLLDAKGLEGGDVVLLGAHDGYAPLFGINHARKIVVAADGSRLRGEDELKVRWRLGDRLWAILARRKAASRIMAHFPLHPTVEARLLNDREAELRLPGGTCLKMMVTEGRLDMKDSRYAPQFGVMMSSRQIVIHSRMVKGACRLVWSVERLG